VNDGGFENDGRGNAGNKEGLSLFALFVKNDSRGNVGVIIILAALSFLRAL
jgi:hypothetical protein